MKKVVWDLFGGLNGSVRKALGDDKYTILTFDILPKTKDGKENIVLDLTDDNVIELMSTFAKPDIIVASPMCMSFSRASAMRNGSTGWIINEDKTISLRPKKDFEDKEINLGHIEKTNTYFWRFDFKKSRGNAILGEKAIVNTFKLIEHYKPTFWYIENPKGSLLWNYVKYNLDKKDMGTFNLVHYGAYGSISKKPTYIFSNSELNLKTVERNWRGYQQEGQPTNWKEVHKDDRSDIPKPLIEDIFGIWEELFDDVKILSSDSDLIIANLEQEIEELREENEELKEMIMELKNGKR